MANKLKASCWVMGSVAVETLSTCSSPLLMWASPTLLGLVTALHFCEAFSTQAQGAYNERLKAQGFGDQHQLAAFGPFYYVARLMDWLLIPSLLKAISPAIRTATQNTFAVYQWFALLETASGQALPGWLNALKVLLCILSITETPYLVHFDMESRLAAAYNEAKAEHSYLRNFFHHNMTSILKPLTGPDYLQGSNPINHFNLCANNQVHFESIENIVTQKRLIN